MSGLCNIIQQVFSLERTYIFCTNIWQLHSDKTRLILLQAIAVHYLSFKKNTIKSKVVIQKKASHLKFISSLEEGIALFDVGLSQEEYREDEQTSVFNVIGLG